MKLMKPISLCFLLFLLVFGFNVTALNAQIKECDDLNKNEQWDTGNIKTLKKLEEIFFFKDSIQIKSNWELDLNVDI